MEGAGANEFRLLALTELGHEDEGDEEDDPTPCGWERAGVPSRLGLALMVGLGSSVGVDCIGIGLAANLSS
jgi:hypothetical protein